MAGGCSLDGAIQDQIDASLKDALELARSRIPVSEGLAHCEIVMLRYQSHVARLFWVSVYV